MVEGITPGGNQAAAGVQKCDHRVAGRLWEALAGGHDQQIEGFPVEHRGISELGRGERVDLKARRLEQFA